MSIEAVELEGIRASTDTGSVRSTEGRRGIALGGAFPCANLCFEGPRSAEASLRLIAGDGVGSRCKALGNVSDVEAVTEAATEAVTEAATEAATGRGPLVLVEPG